MNKMKTKNTQKSAYFRKNKKANIPIMILVIGVFAICILAIISFSISVSKSRDSFRGIDLVEQTNSKIEKYYFYENKGFNDEKIKEILKLTDCSISMIGKCINVNNKKIEIIYPLN